MWKTSALQILLLMIIVPRGSVHAQADSGRAESTGKCYNTSVTREEGWTRALQDAETNAIRSAAGISITCQPFNITSESTNAKNQSDYLNTFLELNPSITCWRIISEEILDCTASVENNDPFY